MKGAAKPLFSMVDAYLFICGKNGIEHLFAAALLLWYTERAKTAG